MGKPKIRFKGYEDDWEQRKLGDCVEIISGEAPAKFQKGNINYVKVDDLNYAYKIVINTQNKVLKNSSAKMVQAGSVIFPKRGAAILTNKVRVLGVDSYMDTNMMALSSEKIDVDFLYIMLQKEGLYKIADTSTIPQINNKHIEPYKIYLPKMEEQHKIGTYFSNLDHLITLHQRKCEETKSLKKYMLQKMFPENGKCVPEIRFSGFSDDWEQRKLSEIAIEKLSNGIMNNQANDETGLRHINVINMYDPDKIHPEKLTFSNYDEDAVKKCNVEWGDIFLTRSSLKPEGIAESNVLLDSGRFVYDDHLIRLKLDKEKYDPFFVKLNLSGSIFKRQFIARAKTTAFTTIGQEDIAECFGLFPEKEEQEKIGTYFSNLDHLITLHQHKCDELQKLKKFMLQNMFM